MTNHQKLNITLDLEQEALLIHAADNDQLGALITMRFNDLKKMHFADASQFIGERIILLMPEMRKIYKDYLWTEDGQPPKIGA